MYSTRELERLHGKLVTAQAVRPQPLTITDAMEVLRKDSLSAAQYLTRLMERAGLVRTRKVGRSVQILLEVHDGKED